jgi:glucose-6-phosphate isomerase
MSALRFDFSNALSERIGPEGIAKDRLEVFAPRVNAAVARLEDERTPGKRDFLNLPAEPDRAIDAAVKELTGRHDDLVVLGIGGSALGTIAVANAVNGPWSNSVPAAARRGRPRLHVLDNVDPNEMTSLLARLDPRRTLVNVISKSGSTAETMAQFLVFRQWMERGGGVLKDQLVVTTDAARGYLRPIVKELGLRSFPIPDGVGGRFSVLTPVGLFPLAMAGVDVWKVVEGARAMADRCRAAPMSDNPAALLAALHVLLCRERAKNIAVLMPYARRLFDLADWFRQLWAESLGKRKSRGGRDVFAGQTPVRSLGATDQHSQSQLYVEGPNDKVITIVGVEAFADEVPIPAGPAIPGLEYLGGATVNRLLEAERVGTLRAYVAASRPTIEIRFPRIEEAAVGEFLMVWEIATAVAGDLLDVDAFDQPGVEAAKDATYALMGQRGYEAKAAEIRAELARPPILAC